MSILILHFFMKPFVFSFRFHFITFTPVSSQIFLTLTFLFTVLIFWGTMFLLFMSFSSIFSIKIPITSSFFISDFFSLFGSEVFERKWYYKLMNLNIWLPFKNPIWTSFFFSLLFPLMASLLIPACFGRIYFLISFTEKWISKSKSEQLDRLEVN